MVLIHLQGRKNRKREMKRKKKEMKPILWFLGDSFPSNLKQN